MKIYITSRYYGIDYFEWIRGGVEKLLFKQNFHVARIFCDANNDAYVNTMCTLMEE